MTLLAAFQVLLYRYTGQEDILVGSPSSGRGSAEFSGTVGYFVNPLVLRGKVFWRQIVLGVSHRDADELRSKPSSIKTTRSIYWLKSCSPSAMPLAQRCSR